jgi:hypothetical protein
MALPLGADRASLERRFGSPFDRDGFRVVEIAFSESQRGRPLIPHITTWGLVQGLCAIDPSYLNRIVKIQRATFIKGSGLLDIVTKNREDIGDGLFSKEANEVMVVAGRRARERQHPELGMRHILLGLVEVRKGVMGALLRSEGIFPERVEQLYLGP